jgi:hypothetical protein
LRNAWNSLKEINAEFRDYVASPLGYINLDQHPIFFGRCFFYSYNGGVILSQYVEKKNYAQQFVIYNQIMPQILKGKLLIYCVIHVLTTPQGLFTFIMHVLARIFNLTVGIIKL